MKNYKRGLRAGIPIGLGYLSVSFSFGIMAVSLGFSWWQAVIISATTLTSAGQLSGIKTMLVPGQYAAMLISQFTINIRYSFMSISLSQKLSPKFRGLSRWLLGYFMTDEIFAVAVTEKEVSRSFFLGLSTLPWFGWTIGTLAGALLGNILPESVMTALGLAMYGMFVAIVAPEMKKSKPIVVVVLISIALSCAFKWLPGLKDISGGLAISICAIIAASIGAWLFPVKEETAEGELQEN